MSEKVQIRGQLIVGPHKGYTGRAEFDADDGSFSGEVMGTRDVVHFEGETPEEVAAAFADSVDDYLEMCAESGKQPEKPYSGQFVTRVSPELHRRVSIAAETGGVSLNQYVSDTLEKAVELQSVRLSGSEATKKGRMRVAFPEKKAPGTRLAFKRNIKIRQR